MDLLSLFGFIAGMHSRWNPEKSEIQPFYLPFGRADDTTSFIGSVSAVGLDEEKIRKYVKWQLEKDKRMEQLKLWQQISPF